MPNISVNINMRSIVKVRKNLLKLVYYQNMKSTVAHFVIDHRVHNTYCRPTYIHIYVHHLLVDRKTPSINKNNNI